jgi:hypothetical protein
MLRWHFPVALGLRPVPLGSGPLGGLTRDRMPRLNGRTRINDALTLHRVPTFNATPRLNYVLILNGRLRPIRAFLLAVDLYPDRTPSAARRLRCGTAPRRLGRMLLVLSGRCLVLSARRRPLGPYRSLDALPHFLRQHRWPRRRGPISGRASYPLRQVPAAVVISHTRQTPCAVRTPGRCELPGIAQHRINGYSSEITNCDGYYADIGPA